MVHVRLDTTDLAAEDRFAAWTELGNKSHVPTIIDSRHQTDFVASIEFQDFGVTQLSRLSHPPLRSRLTATMARSAAEVLLLTHVTRGRLTVHTRDGAVAAPAGSLVVIDASATFTGVNAVAVSHTVLQIPTPLLGLRPAELAALSSAPIGGEKSIGRMLGYLLDDLAQHGDTHPSADIARLTGTVVDLLGAAASLATRPNPNPARSTPEHSRLLQIYTFIQRRLDDPGLTPEAVAAAQAMSVRQLNRILHEDGQSPSDWIRRRRLDRCRHDLLDPALASRPAAAIGLRWGFADSATFNRAFRREYGMPPGEYRRRFAQIDQSDLAE